MKPFGDLPERARIILFLTVALPLAVALVAATLRYGGEFRHAAEAHALTLGDSLGTQATRIDSAAVLAAAAARGYDAVMYRRGERDFRRIAAHPAGRGDAMLERRAAAHLLERGRGIVIRPQGGRTSVLVPVRDPLGGDAAGALLLVHPDAIPPALPALPLLAGLLALTLALLAAAAWARRPGRVRAALVFVPAAAFGALLSTAPPAAPGGGAYRWWTLAYLGLWAALAGTGLWLVRRGNGSGAR
ncbi:MAG TPA: hypothetical protein VK939_07690 [Longimicrobiales bacterium]|nr:hypothetical protein [Longimicrobiales bacterium]